MAFNVREVDRIVASIERNRIAYVYYVAVPAVLMVVVGLGIIVGGFSSLRA